MKLNKKTMIIFLLLFSVYLFGEDSVVKIQKGDTLYKISRKYNVSISTLLNFNGIENADSLKAGQEIRIPSSDYTVKKGDTLYGIARNNGISLEKLCSLNGFEEDHLLKLGEVLILPVEIDSSDYNHENVSVEEKKVIAEKKEQKDTDIVHTKNENTKFFWPHSGERISMNGKLKGEEILGKKGDKIVSVSSGRVVWVAPYRGYGQLIMVENMDHHIYAYGGNDKTFVKVGDNVLPGTPLGLMGISSIEKSAKAFFFVYKNGIPVEPDKAPRG